MPPQPTRTFFDPFNSSSTGHQRAENRLSGSTSWRDSRTHKLAQQLRDSSGRGGESHIADLIGVGSENFGKDSRKECGSWEIGAPGLREKGWQDIRGLMAGSKKRRSEETYHVPDGERKKRKTASKEGTTDNPATHTNQVLIRSQESLEAPTQSDSPRATAVPIPSEKPTFTAPQIFRSLTLYLNGSTLSSGISDHKLKSLFIQHGGSLSIALGRRTVTHVILGSDCGGGLAAGKVQKEVAKVGGKGVKYVTAKWVVDSVESGKRLPEGRYHAVHIALKGQGIVLGHEQDSKE
jgi:BRCT domain, a BRCA1 C-terminus domain